MDVIFMDVISNISVFEVVGHYYFTFDYFFNTNMSLFKNKIVIHFRTAIA